MLASSAHERPNTQRIPCIFPEIREFGPGDTFAAASQHSQPVAGFLALSRSPAHRAEQARKCAAEWRLFYAKELQGTCCIVTAMRRALFKLISERPLHLRTVVAGAVIFASAGGIRAEDCRQIIVKHGYLSQAQFECDFGDYNEALIESAKKCTDSIGTDAANEALKEGMSTAIAEVQSVDELSAWCASILERFPEDVRR